MLDSMFTYSMSNTFLWVLTIFVSTDLLLLWHKTLTGFYFFRSIRILREDERRILKLIHIISVALCDACIQKWLKLNFCSPWNSHWAIFCNKGTSWVALITISIAAAKKVIVPKFSPRHPKCKIEYDKCKKSWRLGWHSCGDRMIRFQR